MRKAADGRRRGCQSEDKHTERRYAGVRECVSGYYVALNHNIYNNKFIRSPLFNTIVLCRSRSLSRFLCTNTKCHHKSIHNNLNIYEFSSLSRSAATHKYSQKYSFQQWEINSQMIPALGL
jgi:hypothetical protein